MVIQPRKHHFSIIILVLIILINILFTSLPLLNILNYESSVLNAVLFSFLSGLYWLHKNGKRIVKRDLYFALLAISIPIIILVVSTLICQKCPLDNGIYFYFIITLPSIFVGIAISCVAKYLSSRFRYLIFCFLWLIMLLSFLPELYFNPQIYFYNPIFGYYPGVIYDKSIQVSGKLVLYRSINLIVSFAVIKYLDLFTNFKQLRKVVVIIGFIMALYASFLLKPYLGFSISLERLKTELTEELKTEHFNIIIPDTLEVKQKSILEYEHEFYYSKLSNVLNTKLDERITSIIYDPGAQKKALFGSQNADVAKPWLNQIYLNLDNYENSLKHEIAHIFSANFSSGLFKVPIDFNPAMIEGFAMAVENNFNDYDISYLAALAYKFEYRISISNLFSGFSFFANASSLSYIYAGSFFKYLADQYGWEKCKQIYNGESFLSVFGREVEILEKEFYAYLQDIDYKLNEYSARYYFSRKPLIKMFCARATAKELKNAQNLLEEKNYESASQKFLDIYSYSNTYSSLVGFAQSNILLDNREKAIKLLRDEIEKFEGTGSIFYLKFLLADIYTLNDDSTDAANLYSSIILENPHPAYFRGASVRKYLLSLGDSILHNYMTDQTVKNQTLIQLVNSNPKDYLIQLLCNVPDFNGFDYFKKIEAILPAIENLEYDAITYFNISLLAYKNLDFEVAHKYADRAFLKSEIEQKSIYKEHLEKIEWIVQNKNLFDMN